MKFGLFIGLLLLGQAGFAQSLKDRKIKEEMISRVDDLITKISEARDALEREDMETSCGKINEIFKIYPKHLIAIGTRMNVFEGDVVRMVQETKMHLIYIHQQSDTCAIGEIGENLDLTDVNQKLKSMSKALVKQKKKITKLDTDYSNTFNYHYEYH